MQCEEYIIYNFKISSSESWNFMEIGNLWDFVSIHLIAFLYLKIPSCDRRNWCVQIYISLPLDDSLQVFSSNLSLFFVIFSLSNANLSAFIFKYEFLLIRIAIALLSILKSLIFLWQKWVIIWNLSQFFFN